MELALNKGQVTVSLNPRPGAQVRYVPMTQLTGGVLHSKFWIVDGKHIYLGSANMDWRSLTQVSPRAQGGESCHSGALPEAPGSCHDPGQYSHICHVAQ